MACRVGAGTIQMNLFGRFFRVIRSYANAVGESLCLLKAFRQANPVQRWYVRGYVGSACVAPAVGSAEDPEKMLDQTVNEMQSDLIRMRQSSAQVMMSHPCKCAVVAASECTIILKLACLMQVLASQKQIENKYNQAKQTSVCRLHA